MSAYDVPCNGCTRCCHGDAIRLLPADDASLFQTVPHDRYPGALMLDHKSNGDCIYLVEGGCSIHERKPQMCREMDCRLIARSFSFTQARKLARSNDLQFAVWQRGRDLLKAGRKR